MKMKIYDEIRDEIAVVTMIEGNGTSADEDD